MAKKLIALSLFRISLWRFQGANCIELRESVEPGSARGPRAGLMRGHAAMKALSHQARTRAACAPRA